MRRRSISILFLLAGLLLLGLVVMRARGPALARSELESRLTASLGVPVRVGSVTMSWSGHALLEDLTLEDPADTRVRVAIPRVEVPIGLKDLLRGRVVPESAVVHAPRITMLLETQSPARQFAAWSERLVPSSAPPHPVRLRIVDGQMTVHPRGRAPAALTASQVEGEIVLANDVQLSLEGALSLEAGAAAHVRPTQEVGLEGTISSGFTLRLSFARTSSGLAATTAVIDLQGGRVASPQLHSRLEGLAARLRLTPEGPRLESTAFLLHHRVPGQSRDRWRVEIPGGLPIVFRGETLEAGPGPVRIEGHPFEARFQFEADARHPLIARFESSNFDLNREVPMLRGRVPVHVDLTLEESRARLGATVGLAGVTLVTSAGARTSALRITRGIARISGTDVRLEAVDVEAAGLGMRVDGTARLEGERLTFAGLSCRLAGEAGAAQVSGILDPTTNPPALRVDAIVDDIHVTQITPRLFPVISRALPPGMELVADGKVQLAGTPAAPRLTGILTPVSGSLTLPLAGERRTARFVGGGAMIVEDTRVKLDGTKVTLGAITGTLDGLLEPDGMDLTFEVTGGRDSWWDLLPKDLDQQLASLQPEGGTLSKARLVGPPAHPRLEARIDLAGATVALPGMDDRARVAKGSLHLQDTKLGVDIPQVETAAGNARLTGTVGLGKDPVLALDLESKKVSPRAFDLSGAKLSGGLSLDVRIEGTAKKPRMSGQVRLAGLEVTLPGSEIPLEIEEGVGRLDGGSLVLESVRLKAGGQHLAASGRIVGLPQQPRLEAVQVDGEMDASRLPVAGLAGRMNVDLTLSGPPGRPVVEGRVNAARLTLPGSTPSLPLERVTARLALKGKALVVEDLQARVAGGRLQGRLTLGDGLPAFDLRVKGLELASLAAAAGSTIPVGRARADLQVSGRGDGPSNLRASGTLDVRGLQVDLRESQELVAKRSQVRQGKGGSLLLGLLLPGVPLKGLAMIGQAKSHMAGQVVDALMQLHMIDPIHARFTASGKRIELAPMKGEDIDGHLAIQLPGGELSGEIERLRLGDAVLSGIEISGTLDEPIQKLDEKRVKLDPSAESRPSPEDTIDRRRYSRERWPGAHRSFRQ